MTDEETQFEELKREVERCELALAEVRKVFDRSGNPEPWEIRRLRRAEDRLTLAQGRLDRVEETRRQQVMRIEAEERRQKIREPPSLQQLVLDYGTYERITPDAWARFDAEMAEWKAKIRAGEFDAQIW